MSRTAGIDIGSTYTKAVIVAEDGAVLGRGMEPTGFRLMQAAERALARAAAVATCERTELAYVVTTGFGRHQAGVGDVAVTDLTAAAAGASHLFPGTRTILDVGGQTMKASRLGADGKVQSFRLNDKCAAGTGAFLEKTARYMGYTTEEIGPLVATSKTPVTISGVCAVFAESEVINQLSEGAAPADIMHGAIVSLVDRSVQLMKRVRMEAPFALIGGILRFSRMADVVRAAIGNGAVVHVPEGDLAQFTAALGAALLGQRRLRRLAQGSANVPA